MESTSTEDGGDDQWIRDPLYAARHWNHRHQFAIPEGLPPGLLEVQVVTMPRAEFIKREDARSGAWTVLDKPGGLVQAARLLAAALT